MKKNKAVFLLVLFSLFYISIFTACSVPERDSGINEGASQYKNEDTDDRLAYESEGDNKKKEEDSFFETVTILGAGDNLIHDYLYESYRTEDGFDFTDCYSGIKDVVLEADISVINSETPMATEIYKPSSWPAFNTPVEDADAIKALGFDVINQGNNHTFDKGQRGVEATLKCWKDRDLPVTGVYAGEEDLNTMRIIEKNGIRVAFLGFVELTNNRIAENSKYQMVFLREEDRVKALIEKAAELSDIVVVSAHWGNEDHHELSRSQIEMSQKMVDWGADIIFGTHPHVLQKLDILKRKSDDKSCVVAYSLGNLVSAQHKNFQMVGGLLEVKAVRRTADSDVELYSMNFMPTVNHFINNRENSKVYLQTDYTEELAELSGVKIFGYEFSLDYIQRMVDAYIPKEYQNRFSRIY